MSNCVFCQIVNNEKSKIILFEDENFLVFLDIRPLFHGHALLIPKKHYETIYDLPEELTKEYFSLSKKIGKAIEKGTESAGSFFAINNIISQSVPHLHTHIVPRNKGDGMKGFFWPRTKYNSEDEMEKVAMQIKKFLD